MNPIEKTSTKPTIRGPKEISFTSTLNILSIPQSRSF